MMKKNNERGSLALYVSIAMIFFMSFLLILYASTSNEQKTQLEVTSRIKEVYEKDLDRIPDVYNEMVAGSNDVIPIYTAEQFKKIGTGEVVYVEEAKKNYTFNMNSKYQLKNNIDLNKGKYTVANDGTVTFDSTATQWIPIGTSSNMFTGELDGNGYKISGLYKTSGDNFGLLGYNNGTIKNLVLDNGCISVGVYSGTIVSQNQSNGVIQNCINRISNISMGRYSGGICDKNDGIIENTVNEGNVTFTRDSGGGICRRNNGVIRYCKNYGNLIGISYVGGISAGATGRIENCYNEGNLVIEGQNAGGIVAYAEENLVIINCYNIGNVEGNSEIAGIISNYKTGLLQIANCFNKGYIKATKEENGIAGGLIGYISNGSTVTLNNAYNIGPIETNGNMKGGIIGNKGGSATLTVSNCFYLDTTAIGAINSAAYTGATEADSTYMRSEEFLTALNNGESNWKYVFGKNNGYPVLSWQE